MKQLSPSERGFTPVWVKPATKKKLNIFKVTNDFRTFDDVLSSLLDGYVKSDVGVRIQKGALE